MQFELCASPAAAAARRPGAVPALIHVLDGEVYARVRVEGVVEVQHVAAHGLRRRSWQGRGGSASLGCVAAEGSVREYLLWQKADNAKSR